MKESIFLISGIPSRKRSRLDAQALASVTADSASGTSMSTSSMTSFIGSGFFFQRNDVAVTPYHQLSQEQVQYPVSFDACLAACYVYITLC